MAILLEIGILLVCFLQVTRSKIVLVLLPLLIRVGVQSIINYAIGPSVSEFRIVGLIIIFATVTLFSFSTYLAKLLHR